MTTDTELAKHRSLTVLMSFEVPEELLHQAHTLLII